MEKGKGGRQIKGTENHCFIELTTAYQESILLEDMGLDHQVLVYPSVCSNNQLLLYIQSQYVTFACIKIKWKFYLS